MAFQARKVSGVFEKRAPEPAICTVPGEDQMDDGSSPFQKKCELRRRESSLHGDFRGVFLLKNTAFTLMKSFDRNERLFKLPNRNWIFMFHRRQ